MFDNKTILVTGGAGAVGSNLLRALVAYNCKIIVIDDLSSGYIDNIPKSKKIKFIKGSITEDDVLEKAFSEKINVVFHLAAFFANQNSVDHPDKDLEVNGYGTLKLLQYASKANIDRFVYTSSSCVYGDVQTAASESKNNYHLDTPYAITKLLGEYYSKYFYENHNVPITILRLFNSYGPGERPGRYRNVIPNFMWRAMHNRPLIITGTGDETRDFNYVGNAVQALLLSATKPEAVGETFNVGSGKETKIKDLTKSIGKAIGRKVSIEYQSRRTWDTVLRRKANIDKTQKILGYKPDNSNFENKLNEVYAWMKTIVTDKILIISPRQWDLQWGQEKDLINSLISKYEVTVLELLDYKNLPATYAAPNRTTVVKRKTKTKPGLTLGFKTEWRNLKDTYKYDFNILITYLTAGSFLATLFAKLRGKKVILIYADDLPELNKNSSKIGYLMTKYFFNPASALLADKIVATARLLAKDISLFGKKVEYIPNGVDIASYKPKKSSVKTEKKSKNYTVGFVGGFGEWINFDLMINAAHKLKDVNFIFVGDGEQYNYIKERTKELKNVKMTGMVSKDKVIEYLDEIDVCTIPFKVNRLTNRVSPIKLFEYWAMKKPVITTSFYEIKKTAKDIAVFADTTEQFEKAIIELKNPKRRKELADKGVREVQKYDWAKLSSKYHDLLEEL